MKRAWPSALLMLVCTLALHAQTADEIVAKAIAARGGLDRIKGVQALRLTGHITLGAGQEGTLIVTWARPGKFRQELVLGGKSVLRVTDGANAWAVNPFSGSSDAQALPPDQMKAIGEQADFDKPLVDYKAKGNQIELIGTEKLEGKDAFKLKVTLKDGLVRYEWIDAETFLEAQWQGKVSLSDGDIEFATSFHDYRTVEGLKYPFQLDTDTIGADMHQKIVVEKIEVNPAIDDALFAKPAPPPPAPAPPPSPEPTTPGSL